MYLGTDMREFLPVLNYLVLAPGSKGLAMAVFAPGQLPGLVALTGCLLCQATGYALAHAWMHRQKSSKVSALGYLLYKVTVYSLFTIWRLATRWPTRRCTGPQTTSGVATSIIIASMPPLSCALSRVR